jgi:general secretion pathway protein G
MKRQDGFTLIELMIVMVLIVILSSVVMVQYGNQVKSSKEAVLRTDLTEMRKAIDAYYADKMKYPASLDTLVEEKYIRAVPVDPFTNMPDWQTTMAEPDPRNPSAESGVGDVKSRSEQTALDGSPYAEW